VLTSQGQIEELLDIAPDWRQIFDSLSKDAGFADVKTVAGSHAQKPKSVGLFELFERLGAKALYKKAQSLKEDREKFLVLVRNFYLQPVAAKMVGNNQNLKRFFVQRRVAADEQKRHALSIATELAEKLEGAVRKHLLSQAEDGFKVLLPAYVQRSVHNQVIDYIREEWDWEKSTLQDLNLDPEQEDPRQNTADDSQYMPENQALSGEQVGQLNQLRDMLEKMLADKKNQKEPLEVVDCMFGLGLTKFSTAGKELTMRECCDILQLPGETQARKIARCQVLLDKGLSMVREGIRQNLPGIADCWQRETNVNRASRRELNQQLGMTESEVERLILQRQYRRLLELVEKSILKEQRLQELEAKGAVAAFVPVDINSATNRDLMDILGLNKETAQKVCERRPFAHLSNLVELNLLTENALKNALSRGCVLKVVIEGGKRKDINSAPLDELVKAGLESGLAKRIERGRPFGTWAELEDYLQIDLSKEPVLRQNFCLGIFSD
jgi:DNA uptake protein ComE-like DNA-binding protein